MAVIIEHCTFADLEAAPNFAALLLEYADECANPKLPAISAKFEMYAAIERSGIATFMRAMQGDLMVGFLVMLSPVMPHYGRHISVTESMFVGKEYRNQGAGLKLMRAAEAEAKEIGSPGMLISAPVGGSLDKLLAASNAYELTNHAYARNFV